MRVTAGQAIEALGTLVRLASADFPAKHAFLIARIIARLQSHPEVAALNMTRVGLVKKLGVEKNGVTSIPPERMQAFADEYAPIACTMLELEVPCLPITILDYAPEMKPSEMMAIQPFFEECLNG